MDDLPFKAAPALFQFMLLSSAQKIDIDPLSEPVFSLRKVVGRHVKSNAFVIYICGFEVRKGLKSATGRSLRTLRLRFLRRTRCRRMFSGLCVVGLGGQSATSPALLLVQLLVKRGPCWRHNLLWFVSLVNLGWLPSLFILRKLQDIINIQV